MNETDRQARILLYLDEVTKQFYSGQAREHSYRPALERLMMSFDKVHAVNEPKHSEHGAPDFVFISDNDNDLILGYAEAKDIDVSLDKTEKTEQMKRYAGYANLFLTDYLEFRFFRNGEKYETISLGYIKGGKLYKTPENGERLMRELEAFLEQTPEKIRSGKRLANIMGGKARRIRDNVRVYLNDAAGNNGEFERMFEMMRKMLVHDLTPEKFADMYAQTLVYGLFVARYGDSTPDNFTRNEARDLVPASNPFLRHFFDHIVGPDFDARLSYIVDELCEIFSVSDVQEIVHRHLKIADDVTDIKDPIIHFYEDFLQEYDASERKRMGAYYTPIPVVQYIVKQVDRILKEEFGIVDGLASSETTQYEVETGQDLRGDRRKAATTHQTITVPRVQVLDPAVGTATFLNETIKFIHKKFVGQEGRWPTYVNDNLLKRLHGFELMMAPYTIAHLKLGMTLKETGVEKLNERLGVYLTNTLEEGIPVQTDLFSFGLAQAVSEESRLAAEVKSERPVMVVMGNPPYSGVSSNETEYANSLISKYKVEPGGKEKLKERKHWLNDDYVKFIAFAEDMIERNDSGVVAMITNNGYLDNPTFRGMRWHLAKTFDKIYVLDLHGNAKKKEVAADGGKDENVFDIMQGVGIILAVKNGSKQGELASVYHSGIYGRRQNKFDQLCDGVEFKQISYDMKNVYFVPKDTSGEDEYNRGISIDDLFNASSTGVFTLGDDFVVSKDDERLKERIERVMSGMYTINELNSDFRLGKNYAMWVSSHAQYNPFDHSAIRKYLYRPFDNRFAYFDSKFIWRLRDKISSQFARPNLALNIGRQGKAVGPMPWNVCLVSDAMVDLNLFYRGGEQVYLLYAYHEDGTRTPNFVQAELSALTRSLTDIPEPEAILDYIYGILHSPSYREKYKEFLKTDFPRIPAPKDDAQFKYFVTYGHELRELHLMKSPVLNDLGTTYPVAGHNMVNVPKFIDSAVYINETQLFGNVPEEVWNFYIGGYQPAQKWLKDRKGSVLSDEDIVHYQKIVKVLVETGRVMKEIG